MQPERALLRVRVLRGGADFLWTLELVREKEAEAAARRESEHKAKRQAAKRKAAEVGLAAL